MLFADSEDSVVANESAEMAFEADGEVAADAAPAETGDAEAAGADAAADASDYAEDSPAEDEGLVDEDDEVAAGDDLTETMNPASDVVDSSATGTDGAPAADAAATEDEDMAADAAGDEEGAEGEDGVAAEDDSEFADGAVDSTAPTPFEADGEPPVAPAE